MGGTCGLQIKMLLAFICQQYKFTTMKSCKKTQPLAIIVFVLTFFFWGCGQAGANSDDQHVEENPAPGEFNIVFATGNHGETDPCG